ncbi:transcription regulator [Pseudomonas phage Persinger]|uniref:Transcription regulator n=1 Tax=Pseudomonas phage Persinger TaxID=2749430 RepID=A0A7D7J6V4_9CAUD|nr:tail protein [Pseudomonas phage Persinger]QMP19188.1 transcription regulator [Pseudomonas phage Persinger]
MGLITGIAPSWRILADQADITATIAQRFISLTLTDAVGMESDTLEITLSDNDPMAPIAIPPTGAELQLFLGYDGFTLPMGMFVCDEVELAGWPGEMVIRARAATYDKSKGGKSDLQTQKTRSWPKGTKLGDMVAKIAKEHGMEPAVAASLKSIALPHTDQADESDINLLVRLAKKYDAVVKPAGGKLVLAKRGESKSVSGEALAPVFLEPADCASWRMVLAKRETAGMVVAYWHAVKQAKRNEVKVGKGEPVRRLKQYYPTEEMALAAARADLARRERGQETISLTVTGSPLIAAEAPLTLAGFRPGVDGQWLISRVTHRLDASGGYVCDVEGEKPNKDESPEVEVKAE